MHTNGTDQAVAAAAGIQVARAGSPHVRVEGLREQGHDLGALRGVAHEQEAQARHGRAPHVIAHVGHRKVQQLLHRRVVAGAPAQRTAIGILSDLGRRAKCDGGMCIAAVWCTGRHQPPEGWQPRSRRSGSTRADCEPHSMQRLPHTSQPNSHERAVTCTSCTSTRAHLAHLQAHSVPPRPTCTPARPRTCRRSAGWGPGRG